MSMRNPKRSDLRHNQVTFQVDTRSENPDLSTTESWADFLTGVWLAIQDGSTRDAEMLGRQENQRTVDCWGPTEILKNVNSDMRFLWEDNQTGINWTCYLDGQPVPIEKDHTYMKFAATAKREDVK